MIKITNHNEELKILRVALLNEHEGYQFYKLALKVLYLKLVDWEWEHLHALQRAYDYAKEEWFEKQGFSPA